MDYEEENSDTRSRILHGVLAGDVSGARNTGNSN